LQKKNRRKLAIEMGYEIFYKRLNHKCFLFQLSFSTNLHDKIDIKKNDKLFL